MPLERRMLLDDRSKLSETALDESLAILSLLDPAEPPKDTQTSKLPHQSITILGKRFLDHLSWLCDPSPKGKTVAGIGVQDSRDGYKFWIASNNGCRHPVKRHLQWLLQILRELIDGRKTKDAVRKDMFQKSIELSSERVKNYVAQLERLLSHCSQLQQTCERDRELSRAVAHILDAQEEHRLVCMRAFEFRGTDVSHTLRLKAMNSGPTGYWQLLRHYIGRLGSWWKAVLIVTTGADKLSYILRNATAHTISLGIIDKKQQAGPAKSLDDVLKSLIPACSSAQLQAATYALQNRFGSDINERFAARLQSQRKTSCSHAEAAVLAHFHRQKFRFAASLPYVGCSKPSCFCCKLYADLHPLRTIPRESHGNTWVKWVLPCPKRVKRGKYCCSCICILQRMLQHIQTEIQRRISLHGLPVFMRPESTTNMSSVAISKADSNAPEEDLGGVWALSE